MKTGSQIQKMYAVTHINYMAGCRQELSSFTFKKARNPWARQNVFKQKYFSFDGDAKNNVQTR